ncbi:PucR family transcriptional regulator [Nonomuraea sp. MG754425]|uniref:helix-turn-helix domain-containing protein n=1 Tax=Nonomuraea sp. MG754425 TaxID=2570319 RepID=UPI001F35F51B|nr:helix-turn-helix domain-containing protein [Nonomuraea sp. MG754425]MCF6472154.1 PucR family transcriptional regulator [Nonomuraea sp. MG754425]
MLDPTFQDVLEELADRLGHALLVDSPDGRLIGYSTQGDADPARVASILARRVPPELRRWQNRHGIARATAPVRLPANAELGIQARLCVPIRYGGRSLGYLWIPGDDPAATPEAATRAAAELAHHLAPASGDRDHLSRDHLTRRLLVSDHSGANARDDLAALDPSLLDGEVVVSVAVPVGRGGARVRALTPAEYARLGTDLPRALRADPACVGSFVTATHAVALSRHPAARPERLDRALRASARGPFAIGVGDPVRFEAEAVRRSHTQARAAAEVAALDPALPRVLPWSGAGPYRMLLRMPAPRSDAVLAPLERAADADVLLGTLETYLDLACDAPGTAVRLHVHRTTVYYRLGRIAGVLGADLRDGLVRTHLHLALKARRLAGRS